MYIHSFPQGSRMIQDSFYQQINQLAMPILCLSGEFHNARAQAIPVAPSFYEPLSTPSNACPSNACPSNACPSNTRPQLGDPTFRMRHEAEENVPEELHMISNLHRSACTYLSTSLQARCRRR